MWYIFIGLNVVTFLYKKLVIRRVVALVYKVYLQLPNYIV